MSRHAYTDDIDDDLAAGRWRGQVLSATRGRRGQKLLRDLLAALEAMPEKRLIAEQLECEGEVCALGALGRARGIDMTGIDPEEADQVAAAFDIAAPLAREIMYENDDGRADPEGRWNWMVRWVKKQIISSGV